MRLVLKSADMFYYILKVINMKIHVCHSKFYRLMTIEKGFIFSLLLITQVFSDVQLEM